MACAVLSGAAFYAVSYQANLIKAGHCSSAIQTLQEMFMKK